MSVESFPSRTIITAGVMTGTSVINSTAVNISGVLGYSIQAIWTAGSTPVGVLKLQGSNDNSNWSDISGATSNVSGNTGNSVFNASGVYYNYVRLVYTNTSGTGTLDASLVTKGQ
jgi:hypothetical protein